MGGFTMHFRGESITTSGAKNVHSILEQCGDLHCLAGSGIGMVYIRMLGSFRNHFGK